jgi:hypothetical protein
LCLYDRFTSCIKIRLFYNPSIKRRLISYHYLEWYQHQLSSRDFDPILKYYLASNKVHEKHRANFLLPHEILNEQDMVQLKKRIQLFLKQKKDRVILPFTHQQLQQFKQLGAKELIFWHGNQYLTGAPHFPGGIPPVLFFQWGNFFGIVKYVVLAEEKALKANILVYFEDRQERNLNECVKAYQHEMQQELNLQKEIFVSHELDAPRLSHFLIKTPVLER